MENSFDNKIKEALENFEMPYDANAWTELEQQLPGNPPSGGAGGAGWKAVAIFAVIATVVATIWYINTDTEPEMEQAIVTDQPVEQTAEPQPYEDEKLSVTVTEENEKTAVKADVAEIETAVRPDNSPKAETDVEVMESAPAEKPVTEAKEPVKVIPTAPETRPLVIRFLASTVEACVGEDISFINESSDMSADMHWDFGDGSTSTDANPVHDYVLAGNYTVTLVGSDKDRTDDHTVSIKVNPTPSPVFNSERKLNGYEAIPLYRFTTATQPNETAIWSFSDGSQTMGNSADHLFREEGEHVAKLTVTNTLGCSNTMEEKYRTEKFNLLSPGSFTPNGDGINETFIPEALPEMGVAFEMTIQNPRTGEVVYRTEDASAPWNGKMNNTGQKLEPGVYVWTVVIKDNVVKNRVFNDKIHLQG